MIGYFDRYSTSFFLYFNLVLVPSHYGCSPPPRPGPLKESIRCSESGLAMPIEWRCGIAVVVCDTAQAHDE